MSTLEYERIKEIRDNSYSILRQLERLNANLNVLNDNLITFYKMMKKNKTLDN